MKEVWVQMDVMLLEQQMLMSPPNVRLSLSAGQMHQVVYVVKEIAMFVVSGLASSVRWHSEWSRCLRVGFCRLGNISQI